MGTYSIYHDLIIHAPVEKVYSAISDPTHLINWWPQSCSGIANQGEPYNFYFGPKNDWWGEVTNCEVNKTFHIKMTVSDADWNPTSFGFDLTTLQEGVQLHFWHVGWPSCNHHFKRSSFCWAMLLNGLREYVEKGVIVPFERRE